MAAVSVDEPAPPPGAPVVSDVIADAPPQSDALLAAARLTANDGRLGHLWRPDAVVSFGGACAMRPFELAGTGRALSPLAEGGVYRSFSPWYQRRSFMVLALSFGEYAEPAMFLSPCGSHGLTDAAAARIARLAPELTGRDTSLLLTRGRAPGLYGGAAGALAGAILDPSESSGGEAAGATRTAVPRKAEPAAQPAPPAKAGEPPAQGSREQGRGNGRKWSVGRGRG